MEEFLRNKPSLSPPRQSVSVVGSSGARTWCGWASGGVEKGICFLQWILRVVLLLFMLAELLFRAGAASSASLTHQGHKITFRYFILVVLCAAALLHDKGKESIGIALLVSLLVTEVPINQCWILCFYCIWLFNYFFNLWALCLWNGMPQFPSLPSLCRVWLWKACFHCGETICYMWGISSSRHNVSL